MKELRFSIYRKLCTVFLTALIPVAFISLLMNQIANTRIRQQGIEKMQVQLALKTADFDNELRRINSGLSAHVLNGEEEYLGSNFQAISSYELGRRVAELNAELGELSLISDCIENVAVYFPYIEREISLLQYYNNSIEESDMERISEYRYRDNGIIYGDGALRIHTVAPTVEDKVPLYVVEVELSDSRLLAFLEDSDEEHYLLAGTDWAVSSMKTELTEDALEKVRLSQKTEGSFTTEGKLFSYRRLTLCDGWLISCTDTSNLFQAADIFRFFILVILIMTGLVMLLVTALLSRSIDRPFQQLLCLFGQVEAGSLDVQTDYHFRDEFVVIFEQFDHMLLRIRELISQSVEREKELKEAEYRQLQAHIAPHFLYNSFNVLRHCILLEDYDSANEMAGLLGNYFRYITYSGEQESIPLLEEYRHMVDYLKIQQIRFQDNIEVEMDELPEKFHYLRVPPFVLQPLVENIFKHGIRDMAYGGHISVRVAADERKLRVTVRDNGCGMNLQELERLRRALRGTEQLSEHSGLVNIGKRLKFLLGDEAGLEVNSERNLFFEAVILIPFEGQAADETEQELFRNEG